MIALFDNLGTFELILCGVAGLLVFGRRLPEVASQAGATLAKFKRSLDGAVQDSGVEQELRKIKEALPTDVSMRDVARAAARKMEDRMRELGEAPQLDATTTATPAPDATSTSTATPITPASNAPSPTAQAPTASPATNVPATQANATGTTPRRGDTFGAGVSKDDSPSPPPRRSDGVDPARHFGPPGSIPRD